jgi:hypothetical protein
MSAPKKFYVQVSEAGRKGLLERLEKETGVRWGEGQLPTGYQGEDCIVALDNWGLCEGNDESWLKENGYTKAPNYATFIRWVAEWHPKKLKLKEVCTRTTMEMLKELEEKSSVLDWKGRKPTEHPKWHVGDHNETVVTDGRLEGYGRGRSKLTEIPTSDFVALVAEQFPKEAEEHGMEYWKAKAEAVEKESNAKDKQIGQLKIEIDSLRLKADERDVYAKAAEEWKAEAEVWRHRAEVRSGTIEIHKDEACKRAGKIAQHERTILAMAAKLHGEKRGE